MATRQRTAIRFATGASLLLAVTLSLPGSPLGLGLVVDEFGFRLWHSLFPPSNQGLGADSNLQLVELPASISSAPRASFESARDLHHLLIAVQQHEAAAVGITSDLRAVLPRAQDVVALLPPAKRRDGDSAIYHRLQQASTAPAVTWLLPPPAFAQQAPAVARESRWPIYYNLHEQLLKYFLTADASERLMRIDTPGNPVLLSYRNEALSAGFELTLLALANDANDTNNKAALRWQIPDLIAIGAAGRTLSPLGGLRPWPQDNAIAALQSAAIPGTMLSGDAADPATAARLKQKIVMLGEADDDHWQRSAGRLNALMTGQYSHSPWWQALPLTLLTLVLWCCAVLAMDRWSSTRLMFGTALLAATTLACTIAVQHYSNLWLASGDAIVFTLATGALLVARRARRDWRIVQQLEADDARLQLADLLIQHDNPARAIEQLERTAMSRDSADLLAKAAQAFIRQGNSAAALHAYRRIQRYFPHHQEASHALRALGQDQHPGYSTAALTLVSRPAIKQLGRYELIRPLGKGAMGEVFLAEDPSIRRQVAIKTLRFDAIEQNPEDARQRFFREAEAAGKLEHPHIVSVYDVGEQDGLAYIAMEYVPGGTLADWTDAQRLLDLETLYRLMTQAAQALDHAHRHNIVHRDIKPANLLFNPADQCIKITDFGIAQLADYSRTRTGSLLGSPYYMSPEQVCGQHIGPGSDLYSLGVTFYQLLCGSLPFDAETLAQLAWQITNEPHHTISRQRKGLPRSAGRIINQALAKEPAQRFSDASAMSEAFNKGARQLASSARKAG